MENNSDSLNLQTVRLEIRNLHMQDLPGFYAYRSNPEVTKYQGFDVMSVEQAKAFIEDNATKKFSKAGEWVQYAIAEKTTGKLVGDCAIRLDQYDTRPWRNRNYYLTGRTKKRICQRSTNSNT